MRKIIVILCFGLYQAILFGQALNTARFRVTFIDKKHSRYSLSNPSEFLTFRCIDKRQKYRIGIDESDLPISTSYIDSIISLQIPVICTSKWFNTAIVDCDLSKASLIKKFSFVKECVQVSNFNTMNFNVQKRTKNESSQLVNSDEDLYGESLGQIKLHEGLSLHNNGFKGDNILIAVLDAGFYMVNENIAFDSIFSSNRLIGSRDIINPGGNVYEENSHGASVLSIMAGNIGGVIVGTAPHASYFLIRTEESRSETISEEDYWVSGAELADSLGADIIHSSLGYNLFDIPSQNHSLQDLDGKTTLVSRAASIASMKGILVVSSAGNEGNDPWGKITFPADADAVLTVGAIKSDGTLADFSSRGNTKDGRIKPDVVSLGFKTSAIRENGKIDNNLRGTSFSSPIITGLAACLWNAFPKATNTQIKEAIIKSSSQYYKPDSLYGYGVPNFRKAQVILRKILNDPEIFDDVIIYPNPFSEKFSIDIFEEKDVSAEINISDMFGKIVYQVKTEKVNCYVQTHVIDFRNKPSGIYNVLIKRNNSISCIKIVCLH